MDGSKPIATGIQAGSMYTVPASDTGSDQTTRYIENGSPDYDNLPIRKRDAKILPDSMTSDDLISNTEHALLHAAHSEMGKIVNESLVSARDDGAAELPAGVVLHHRDGAGQTDPVAIGAWLEQADPACLDDPEARIEYFEQQSIQSHAELSRFGEELHRRNLDITQHLPLSVESPLSDFLGSPSVETGTVADSSREYWPLDHLFLSMPLEQSVYKYLQPYRAANSASSENVHRNNRQRPVSPNQDDTGYESASQTSKADFMDEVFINPDTELPFAHQPSPLTSSPVEKNQWTYNNPEMTDVNRHLWGYTENFKGVDEGQVGDEQDNMARLVEQYLSQGRSPWCQLRRGEKNESFIERLINKRNHQLKSEFLKQWASSADGQDVNDISALIGRLETSMPRDKKGQLLDDPLLGETLSENQKHNPALTKQEYEYRKGELLKVRADVASKALVNYLRQWREPGSDKDIAARDVDFTMEYADKVKAREAFMQALQRCCRQDDKEHYDELQKKFIHVGFSLSDEEAEALRAQCQQGGSILASLDKAKAVNQQSATLDQQIPGYLQGETFKAALKEGVNFFTALSDGSLPVVKLVEQAADERAISIALQSCFALSRHRVTKEHCVACKEALIQRLESTAGAANRQNYHCAIRYLDEHIHFLTIDAMKRRLVDKAEWVTFQEMSQLLNSDVYGFSEHPAENLLYLAIAYDNPSAVDAIYAHINANKNDYDQIPGFDAFMDSVNAAGKGKNSDLSYEFPSDNDSALMPEHQTAVFQNPAKMPGIAQQVNTVNEDEEPTLTVDQHQPLVRPSYAETVITEPSAVASNRSVQNPPLAVDLHEFESVKEVLINGELQLVAPHVDLFDFIKELDRPNVIVRAASEKLWGKGGSGKVSDFDQALNEKSGEKLQEACRKELGRYKERVFHTGDIVVTPAYKMEERKTGAVFHIVGPGSSNYEDKKRSQMDMYHKLFDCYIEVLREAAEKYADQCLLIPVLFDQYMLSGSGDDERRKLFSISAEAMADALAHFKTVNKTCPLIYGVLPANEEDAQAVKNHLEALQAEPELRLRGQSWL